MTGGFPRPHPLPPGPLDGRHVRLEWFDEGRHLMPFWERLEGTDPAAFFAPMGWPNVRTPKDLAKMLRVLRGGAPTFIPAWRVDRRWRYAKERQGAVWAQIDRKTGTVFGIMGTHRADPEEGRIGLGPTLRRTGPFRKANREGYLVMLDAIFEAGWYRCEIEVSAGNAASLAVTRRGGYFEEGLHRGRLTPAGRIDMTRFSLLAPEWPRYREAFVASLADGNFDADGRQIRSIADILAERGGPLG